jgi:hypothetical protein
VLRCIGIVVLLAQPALADDAPKAKPACSRVVLPDTSIEKVRVIGVVKQGRAEQWLVVDGKTSHIVKPRECVGRERKRIEDMRPAPLPDTPPKRERKKRQRDLIG